MSSELYETLVLAFRYIFTALGVLILIRAFSRIVALSAQGRTRKSRPLSGCVGELIVISGTDDLETGYSFSVPWEGVLGSIRSCDICIPSGDVRKKHLFFSYEPGLGLLIRPCRGCSARINRYSVNDRSDPEAIPMIHGSFLQIGNLALRLRVFAGLDPYAGFDPPEQSFHPEWPAVPDSVPAEPLHPSDDSSDSPLSSPSPVVFPDQTEASPAGPFSQPGVNFVPEFPPYASAAPEINEEASSTQDNSAETSGAAVRPRRKDRWEADWSE